MIGRRGTGRLERRVANARSQSLIVAALSNAGCALASSAYTRCAFPLCALDSAMCAFEAGLSECEMD